MLIVSAVAILTVVASDIYGNRLVDESITVNDQPLLPLILDLRSLASRNSYIEHVSVDVTKNEIQLVVRANELGRARAFMKNWLDERNAEKILSQSTSALIQKLLNTDMKAGSNAEAALEGIQFKANNLGLYTQYVFPYETDGSVLTLIDRAGDLLYANVLHPKWRMTFFNDIPAEHAEKILEIQKIRAYISGHPASAIELEPYLRELLSALN
jgi:hypothetical protein